MKDGPQNNPPGKRRVTAKAVADAVGVSRSAVSRAFTEGAYLDGAKRQAIREMAETRAIALGEKNGFGSLGPTTEEDPKPEEEGKKKDGSSGKEGTDDNDSEKE